MRVKNTKVFRKNYIRLLS